MYTPCSVWFILILWPGIEPTPSAVEVWVLTRWTARKIQSYIFFIQPSEQSNGTWLICLLHLFQDPFTRDLVLIKMQLCGELPRPLMRSCCLKRTALHLAARWNFFVTFETLTAASFSSKVIPATRGNLCEERPGWWALLAIEVWSLTCSVEVKMSPTFGYVASLVAYSCKPMFVKTWGFIHWLGKCLGDWLEDSCTSAQTCSFRLSEGGSRICYMLRETLEVICYAPQGLNILIYF